MKVEKAMKTQSFILPAYWASYLINGDASGISDDDKACCDRFIESRKLGAALACSDESWFSHTNDSGNGLAGDVLEYTFPA